MATAAAPTSLLSTSTLDPRVELSGGKPASPTPLRKSDKVAPEGGPEKKVEDITDAASTLTLKIKDQPSCDWAKGLKAVGVAVAIAGIFAGVVGLLVYLDILQISLTHVGTMSQAVGLYTTLGGFGAAALSVLLLGVAEGMSCAKEKGEKHQPLVRDPIRDDKKLEIDPELEMGLNV